MKSLTTIYEGIRGGDDTAANAVVTRDGESIDWRLDLRNHSPTGLNWSYCGSGPAQCALAVLADFLENDHRALELYQDFKFKVIAGLKLDYWRLTGADIMQSIDSIILERTQR